MTLNDEMARIFRYFAEFGSFRGALPYVVHKAIWTIYDYLSSSKLLQRDRATPTV